MAARTEHIKGSVFVGFGGPKQYVDVDHEVRYEQVGETQERNGKKEARYHVFIGEECVGQVYSCVRASHRKTRNGRIITHTSYVVQWGYSRDPNSMPWSRDAFNYTRKDAAKEVVAKWMSDKEAE